ncbi:UvrD-helicase domain-containing protein, partial [uncultured Treponema sp.]|uniref:ATP-dependent helicase n=1 Tax=uncultured Treponema sp. TaxID=162155 RepID=UPI002595447C
QAVRETEGYVRVIAGAGSGKTKLLVSRYAYLVTEYGIDSSNILCVTFTNKAAGEMKKRISKLIGPEYSTSLICTYHGFCARLLRENPEKLFLTRGFQIIDTYQQKTLLEEIYQKYELKLDWANFQSILKKIAQKKQDISYVSRMAQADKVQLLSEINILDDQIIEEYMQRQKAVYSLDFTDLMMYAIYLLTNDEEVRNKWQERLNYIQVDEFQDSSSIEMQLVDILSGKYQNLMIVGDPDQNIYEWRGSDVKLLVDFDKNHPGTKTIILNQNYRSTPQILNCANTLIEKNDLRLKKDLFTKAAPGTNVFHIHSKTEDKEVEKIVETIRKIKKEKGKSYSDFAVLYRSGFLSRVIERKLVEEGIPYEIYGGVKFYQRMEILDVVAYLRLIAFNDDLSFKRIINTPRRKFGRTRVAALERIRENNEINLFDVDLKDKSLYEVLKTHLGDQAFNGSGGGQFVSLIENLKALKDRLKISELINRVCIDSGYEQYIRELGDEERLDNLSEFKRIANEFESGFGEDINLEGFLQQIALMSTEDTDKPVEAVKLMTIHASKGLEFPVVFIIGFSEGIFPSSRTIEERKKLGLEEERRLCYVAITRAQEFLYLTDSEGQSQNGIKKLPSRFLFEIGEQNYKRVGRISDDLEREAFGYMHRLDLSMTEELLPEQQSGELYVEHHIFGKGRVISFDTKRKVYTVQFENMTLPRSISADYFSKKHESLPVIKALPQEKEVEYLPPEIESNSLSQKIDNSLQPTDDLNKLPLFEQETEKEEEYRSLPHWDEDVDKEEFTIEIPELEKNGEDVSETVEEIEITEDREDEEEIPDEKEIPPELKAKLDAASNHWEDPNFPKTGWSCTSVTDLGAPVGICEMCGWQIIRYVHHMVHNSGLSLDCGCVCAGKLEGNIERAKKRESAFKNKEARKFNFKKRTWKKSGRGNEYLKIKNHIVVLFHFRDSDKWKYSIDNEFCKKSYNSRNEVIEAVFEALEKLLYS